MSATQSKSSTIQSSSTKAPSYLCYSFKRGNRTLETRLLIRPYQSYMVDKDGLLSRGLWTADNTGRLITEGTAWETRQHDNQTHDQEWVIPQTLSCSLLRPGEKPIPLGPSFALIADRDGNVEWWGKSAADDTSGSTSGTNNHEEPEGEGQTRNDRSRSGSVNRQSVKVPFTLNPYHMYIRRGGSSELNHVSHPHLQSIQEVQYSIRRLVSIGELQYAYWGKVIQQYNVTSSTNHSI